MAFNYDAALNEMKRIFDKDTRRIDHALSVLNYAEAILAKEGGDRDVICAAAIFHDIGIHEAERKYQSTAGHYQELEGPPIARPVLEKMGCTGDFIDEVCEIIAHHHRPGIVQTHNFQVVYEADWLVNLGDDFKDVPPDKKRQLIERNFKTPTGKAMAETLYL